jgi:Tol biopolymer transport system component
MTNRAASARRSSRRFALILLGTATLILFTANSGSSRVHAQAPPCGITQVTTTTGGSIFSEAPSSNADGALIAFWSYADLTGQNADGNPEIFTYNTSTNTYKQVTQTLDPASNSSPSMSADGTLIAFVSFANLTGQNPEGSQVIFLYDSTTSSFKQLTISPVDPTTGFSQISFHPQISANGNRVVFSSNADLTGENRNFATQLFLYEVSEQGFTQLTSTNGGFSNHFPSISADGRQVAFQRLEFTGQSAIFLYDGGSGLTNLTGFAANDDLPRPSINAEGTRIAFAFRTDLTGGNPDGNAEVFLFNAASNSFAQVTNTVQPTNFQPSISADGSHVAFVSNGNLTGGNNDFNPEIFLYDITTSGFKQVTNSPGGGFGNNAPFLNSNGTRVAFTSDRDLTGGNPDGNQEIFSASCLPPPPTTFTISGRVAAATGRPITKARIIVSGTNLPTPLNYYTNRRGNYITVPLAPGTYNVTVSQRRFTFSPPSRTVLILSSNVINANFTGTP